MSYEEWLDNINLLLLSNNHEVLDKLYKEDINNNINDLINDKLNNLVRNKLKLSIERIIKNLSSMYEDQYYLDMMMLNFRKDILFIKDILKLKQFDKEYKYILVRDFKNQVDDTFKILENESIDIDPNGSLLIIIRNYRINWSDIDEL